MVYQVAPFPIAIPVGTSKAAPVRVATNVGNLVVVGIEYTAPRGFNGVVGWRFTSGGAPVIPSDPTAWIVDSDHAVSWPINGQLSSGAWEVSAYNLGVNPHTLLVRYLLDLPANVYGTPQTTVLDPAAIMGATGTVVAGSVPQPSP